MRSHNHVTVSDSERIHRSATEKCSPDFSTSWWVRVMVEGWGFG